MNQRSSYTGDQVIIPHVFSDNEEFFSICGGSLSSKHDWQSTSLIILQALSSLLYKQVRYISFSRKDQKTAWFVSIQFAGQFYVILIPTQNIKNSVLKEKVHSTSKIIENYHDQ